MMSLYVAEKCFPGQLVMDKWFDCLLLFTGLVNQTVLHFKEAMCASGQRELAAAGGSPARVTSRAPH